MRIASELRDLPLLSLELTKEVHPYRGYPDPANYGTFQGGLPSGVRVFAMTLEEAPLVAVAGGNRHGGVYVQPEKPLWQVDLGNRRACSVGGRVRLVISDPYGRKAGTLESAFTLPGNGGTRIEFPLSPELYGLYTVVTEVEVQGNTNGTGLAVGGEPPRLARMGTFLQLPPDERRATIETSPWSLGWSATHERHDVVENVLYLLRAAGARGSCDPRRLDAETARLWGVLPRAQHVGPRAPRAWAFEDNPDPALLRPARNTERPPPRGSPRTP